MCKYRVEGCILQDPVVSEGEWDGWIDVRCEGQSQPWRSGLGLLCGL